MGKAFVKNVGAVVVGICATGMILSAMRGTGFADRVRSGFNN